MKKKVLVMSFGSDAGGIEKSLIEFLKFLVNDGHEVDLYLWRPPGILFNKIPQKVNIILTRLYPGSLSSNISIKGIVWYVLFRIFSALKDPTKMFKPFPITNYDIAISFCQNGYSPHYIINKVIANRKIIFYHHGSYDQTGRRKKIDNKYFCRYDDFITVSNAAKSMLQHHFPRLINISVINNLIDDTGIIRLSKTDNPFRAFPDHINICSVGRISPEKGQKLAIHTAKCLKDNGIKFKWWFIGDGPDREPCEKLSIELNVADSCIFTGSKSNPYPYMRCCNVYVQPSYIEADPVTIRETKLLNCNIVATNIAAIIEALDGYKNGTICELDSEKMAHAIMLSLQKNLNVSEPYHSVNENIKQKLRLILR